MTTIIVVVFGLLMFKYEIKKGTAIKIPLRVEKTVRERIHERKR